MRVIAEARPKGMTDLSEEGALALAPQPTMTAIPPPKVKWQLDFLHGLRGLAAFYIVLFHLTGNLPGAKDLPQTVQSLLAWMKHGYYAVDVFIVLSGFLLMSPVVRAGGVLSGGMSGFLKRRAKRIIPAYFAAYAAFLVFWQVVAWSLARAGETPNAWIQGQLQACYTWKSLLAHGLLLHNLHPDWICNGSNIFWTVALEWQIYFVFVLLLLPIWRYLGTVAAVAAALAVGFVPVYLVPSFFCPVSWLVGLFGMGMAGAVIAFSSRPVYETLRKRVPWGVLAALLAGGAVLMTYKLPPYYAGATPRQQWPLELLAGGATVCLILRIMKNYGAPAAGGAVRARCLLGRFLELKPVIALSLFSYSLYLTHDMVVMTLGLTVWRLGLKPMASMWVYYGVGIPVALLQAYCFYLLFERPGLLGRIGGAWSRLAALLPGRTRLTPAPTPEA